MGSYLVPMLLHASFSSLRKGLREQKESVHVMAGKLTALGSDGRSWVVLFCFGFFTFAISLQLFPASLICFSRSSSAGVQGVLVLLFFTFGSCAPASASAAWGGGALFACTSAPAAELAMSSCELLSVTDLRFRFVGEVTGCWTPTWESCAVVMAGAAGCKLGSSVGAVY